MIKNTKKRLSEYWDERVLRLLPKNANFKKVEQEAKEHFSFIGTTIKRVITPLIIFYIALGLVMGLNVFGSLLLTLIVFLYSNFIPDIDFLIARTERKSKESLWYEKYFWLLFTPVIAYYILIGKAKPIYSTEHRCFHNIKSTLIWGIFLFLLGHILWDETIKIIMFTIFGFLGYLLHLTVDGLVFQSLFWKERIEQAKKQKLKGKNN